MQGRIDKKALYLAEVQCSTFYRHFLYLSNTKCLHETTFYRSEYCVRPITILYYVRYTTMMHSTKKNPFYMLNIHSEMTESGLKRFETQCTLAIDFSIDLTSDISLWWVAKAFLMLVASCFTTSWIKYTSINLNWNSPFSRSRSGTIYEKSHL